MTLRCLLNPWRFSFSIYLIHGIPQAVSKYYLYDEGYLIWKLVSVATLGVIAPIMYKYIEKPTMHINLLAAQKVS